MALNILKAGMPPAGKSNSIEGTASATLKDGSEVVQQKNESENLGVVTKAQVLVGVGLGTTVNLGDFNSLRVDATIVVPCDNDVDAIEEAYTAAAEWVTAKVEQLADDSIPKG